MELRHKYDLTILLDCLQMARSSFYYYLKQMDKKDKYTEIKAMIQSIYHKHKGRLGYRRITLLQVHSYFAHIYEVGDKISKMKEFRNSRYARGNKHGLYVNRTYFGLYNLLNELDANIVTGEKYLISA